MIFSLKAEDDTGTGDISGMKFTLEYLPTTCGHNDTPTAGESGHGESEQQGNEDLAKQCSPLGVRGKRVYFLNTCDYDLVAVQESGSMTGYSVTVTVVHPHQPDLDTYLE